MLTKKVKRRILFLTLLISFSLISIFFIIKTLSNNFLYFRTPSDVFSNANIKIGKQMRLGGMVKKNSILTNSEEIKFVITDYKNEIIVTYKGLVPNLFMQQLFIQDLTKHNIHLFQSLRLIKIRKLGLFIVMALF